MPIHTISLRYLVSLVSILVLSVFLATQALSASPATSASAAVQPSEGLLKITDIEITGNKTLDKSTILSMMTLKIGDEITRTALTRQVRDLFATGYFADVIIDTNKYLDGTKVSIKIIENPTLKDVVFEGNNSIPSATLRKLFESQIGKVMSLEAIDNAAKAVAEEYKKQGYILARINNIDDKDDGTLVVSIKEGEIENIIVVGNSVTNSIVLTRNLKSKPGTAFNTEKIQKDYQNLYNLGIFEEVTISPEPSVTSPDKVSLKISVREGRSGTFGLNGGTSNLSGLFIGANVSFKNFMGMNRKLTLSGTLGQLQTDYTFSYFDPWIDDNRTSFGFDAVARTTNNIYYSYKEQRNFFDIIVGRMLSDELGVSLTAKTEQVNILSGASTSATGSPITTSGQPLTVSGTNSDRINTLSGVVTYDTRDVKRKAHQGLYSRLGVDKAGGIFGGDANFTRYNVSQTFFFPVGELQTLILNGQFATISGTYGISEKFYMGGSTTLRGYPDLAFSGDNMILSTLEYTFPMFIKNLEGAFFVDAGATYLNNAPSIQIHTSYGFGIRFDTPIAPIRIDYAIPTTAGYLNKVEFGIGSKF